MPSYRRFAALAVAVVTLTGASVGAALAHPFGPPLTASATADGSTVEVVWTGAEDDWMALGDWTGAFEASTDPSRTGAQILQESPEVRDYLLENLTVSQQGQECAATWEGIEDLLEGGARVRFDCPLPVAGVDVSVTALTDINQAYRTVVTTGDRQTLFTATDPTHTLDLTDTSRGDQTPVLLLSSAGAVLLVAGAAWAFAARRPTRRTESRNTEARSRA